MNKAMLKLNNSFCRYWRFTYGISKTQQSSYRSCSGKTCIAWYNQQTVGRFIHTAVQCQLLANIKKRFRNKKTYIYLNDTRTSKQMSEPVPTVHHVSYGGRFEVSEDENISSEWRRRSDENSPPQEIPSNFRLWEPVNVTNDTQNGDALRFKLVSYNVLAQYLLECHPYLYTECSQRNLSWNVRAAKLYDEILQLAPDIFCLQEVQVSHLKSFYSKFEELGYLGIFKQKTGHRQDGCAIYFKESLFHMQDQISVEFYQPELPILNRDNIGLMVKLAPKNSPTSPFVVATTHLLYNPKRTDVRLAQLQVLLAEIDRFAYSNNGRESIYLPTILTGDLNSTPDSAVIQLLNRGYVSAKPYREKDYSDFKKIGVTDNCQHLAVYLNRQKGVPTDFSMTKLQNTDYDTGDISYDTNSQNHSELFNTGGLGHSLKLKSVYDNVKLDGSIEATTFQDYWVTVDYIYFSRCSSLRLVERLRLPTEQECVVLGQLPNDKYGSDHLALAATFELKSVKANL
ncbi:protein angel homolog 2-like isoform X2 [Aricia agestis]|uniref:protein angel homolog 2-like isoform X2 n=1 Tax=Aricia agestis TaxID=91739 RepID=UPI001C2039B0|nr:protein angel homolog 2-like isoform X2 [Aricia agestis]XP_041986789.1 protein angel homolog 2-like isoform X2 [Aricia agestis]